MYSFPAISTGYESLSKTFETEIKSETDLIIYIMTYLPSPKLRNDLFKLINETKAYRLELFKYFVNAGVNLDEVDELLSDVLNIYHFRSIKKYRKYLPEELFNELEFIECNFDMADFEANKEKFKIEY